MIACSYASTASGPQVLVLRIIGRVDEDRRSLALAQDFNLDCAAHRCKFRLDIAQTQTFAQGVPIVARGRAADDIALQIEQRLVSQRVGIRDSVNFEGDEAVRYAGLELFLESLFPDEGTFAQAHEAIEAGLI